MNTLELELFQRQHRFGHAYSPEALKHGLLEYSDLSKLNGNEPVAKAITQSYQEWMAPVINQRATLPENEGGLNRPINPDGDIGPATTYNLLQDERCGFPDYPHPDKGYLTYSDNNKELILGAIDEANFPNSCRMEITASYKMELQGLSDAQLLALTKEGSANWMKVFEINIIQRNDLYPNTNRYSFKANLGGSILADQYLATNNCNARLRGRYDNRNWSAVLYVTTHTHEEGHFWGSPHVRDSNATMYPSITNSSMSRRGAPNASDIAQMKRLGYTDRTSDPDPDPDPDPESGIEIEVRGSINVNKPGKYAVRLIESGGFN